MSTKALRAPFVSLLAITVALSAFPVGASAAEPAAVTITACKGDALTLAGKVKLVGKDARKARGAALQLRFQALALFGLPRAAAWKTIGKKTKASDQAVFTGLGANDWIGLMSWRFKKGRRTVLSGNERSQPLRIGGSTGRSDCTIAEGLKPADTTPPQLLILPADELWHRAPATVQLFADDDFSGVRSMQYSLDGGAPAPIGNRGTFDIAAEGQHTVAWSATDVAGNTASRTALVRVDAAPPTKPVVQSPASVTANRAPMISWSPSTDTGSGMRGYVVTIQRADGSTVASIGANASTTSVSAPTLDDNQTYTVIVTAVDNTAGQPWATNSDPYTFRVDTTAEVTSVTPASGSVLSGSAKDGNFTLTLDRPADPSTVAGAVKLTRNPESTTPATPSMTIGCANSPCTQITVDPSSMLPEGRYTLTVNGLKSGDGEGTTFQSFSAAYSVAFTLSATEVHPGGGFCLGNQTADSTTTINAADGSETGTLDFDWSYASGPGWTAQTIIGGNPVGDQVTGGAGSGHAALHFPIPAGTNTITFRFTSTCSASSSTTLDATNLVGARTP